MSLALLALGQLADALTLYLAGQHGLLGYEANGITAALLGAGGVPLVFLTKLALVALVVAAAQLAPGRRWTRYLVALVALSGFIGAAFNLGAML